jgi:hypothetical protein
MRLSFVLWFAIVTVLTALIGDTFATPQTGPRPVIRTPISRLKRRQRKPTVKHEEKHPEYHLHLLGKRDLVIKIIFEPN